MKDIKYEIENIQEAKLKYEDQYKAFQVTIEKKSKEFKVVRYLYGIYHLAQCLFKKQDVINQVRQE